MKVTSIEAVARALKQAQVRYLVVGGVAVNAHGYGRTTYDLDLVIELEPANIRATFESLSRLGYRAIVPISAEQFCDASLREKWRVEKGMVVLSFTSDLHPDMPVDLFVQEPLDFAAEYAQAYQQFLAPELALPLLRLEALLAMKQAAARPKDLADLDELRLLHNRASSYE